MELKEVISTTFAARQYTDDAVPDEVLHEILDVARFAPSGGNRQGWHVIVVRDAGKRQALQDLCEPTMRRYVAQAMAGEAPWNVVDASAVSDADVAAAPPATAAVATVTEAPVLLAVLYDRGLMAAFDKDLDRVGIISGASVYPFVWNILLAARNLGYGGTITTFAAAREAEALAVLGAPERYGMCALVPLGRPVKQLTKLRRKPVAEFTSIDTLDGPTFG